MVELARNRVTVRDKGQFDDGILEGGEALRR